MSCPNYQPIRGTESHSRLSASHHRCPGQQQQVKTINGLIERTQTNYSAKPSPLTRRVVARKTWFITPQTGP